MFGWAIFPAFGLLVRGIAGLSEGPDGPAVANARERELLEALQRRGEMTPTQAAMETSLTVNEADEMLEDLAAKGHLDVKVRGGGMFYGLWETVRGPGSASWAKGGFLWQGAHGIIQGPEGVSAREIGSIG